ncbi:Cell division control protein 6 -like protein, partial [Trichinella pseudospiralis]
LNMMLRRVTRSYTRAKKAEDSTLSAPSVPVRRQKRCREISEKQFESGKKPNKEVRPLLISSENFYSRKDDKLADTPKDDALLLTPKLNRKSTPKSLTFEDDMLNGNQYNAEQDESVLKAMKMLRFTAKLEVYCREKEIDQISTFITNCIKNESSGSLYIAGYPGTGKTMSVTAVMNQAKKTHENVNVVFLNCMNAKSPLNLFRLLAENVGLCTKGKNVQTLIFALEKHFKKLNHTLIICLDEIDCLCGNSNSVLYRTFCWPDVSENIILIGIANAFDMIDRELPKLKLQAKKTPQLLHFTPYSKDQVAFILQKRLESTDIVDRQALEYCARKVSAVTGDIRKALDMCKISLQNGCASACKDKSKIIDSAHVANTVTEVFERRFELSASTLPFQQKLILAVILRMRRRNRKQFSVMTLYKDYTTVCQKVNVPKLTCSEVQNACELMESNSILVLANKNKEYKLNVEEERARHFIQDDANIIGILQENF